MAPMNPASFNPEKLGPRSRAAYEAVMNGPLWGPRWWPWSEVVDIMLARSDILPRSCSNILQGMVAKGICESRGAWQRGNDTRELRFMERDDDETAGSEVIQKTS